MRRRLSLLLATVLAGGTLTFLAPAQPVSAWTVCAVAGGTATVTPGLKYPVGVNLPTTPVLTTLPLSDQLRILIGWPEAPGEPNSLHGFTLTGLANVCTHGAATTSPVTASGTLLGFCGHSVGTGTVNPGGILFAYVSAGTFLILTGHLLGAVHAIPNPDSTTGSCTHFHNPVVHAWSLNNGATNFIVEGGAVGLNCTGLQPLVPGTPEDTEILITTVRQDTLVANVHVWIYWGFHFYWNHQCVGNPIL